ncbi:BspA family leucine-rich repeat surface protein [Enterococcus faecalis]|uniref:BspA family leucine-rich repeat surface protein n=1 Tax=Enterococcus faecalis TaxID=1351 RepID=UPI002FBDB45D
MSWAFRDFHNLERIDLNGSNWNWVNKASAMFQNDAQLNTVRDYSNISDTSDMFYGCSALQTVTGLENANFYNVSTMKLMFYNTSLLQSVPVETWTVGKVTDTSYMFAGSGITQAGGAPWKVTNMNNMFWGTPNLKYVDTNLWRIDKLASAEGMFKGSSIGKIDLSTWKPTQTGIDMSTMFSNTPNLRQVDMRGFTNLDNQITINILGTGQAANPLMLIIQEVAGNKYFGSYDFKTESGRIPVPMPNITTDNINIKLKDGSTQKSYISTIPVYTTTLEINKLDAWIKY